MTGQNADGIADNDPDLFEPSTGTRHELCSQGSEPWINNEIKTDKSHSFHPNQAGENALGALAASVIEHLTWPWTPVAPWDGPAVVAPAGLQKAASWVLGGSSPWAGCSLYLPTQAGITAQPGGNYGGSSGVADYFVQFTDRMDESVWPPNSTADYAPDFPAPSRVTYSDGSVEETDTVDGETNILITIPGQPCSFEFNSGMFNNAANVAALVQSVRLISGTEWTANTPTPTTPPTTQPPASTAGCPDSQAFVAAWQSSPGTYGNSPGGPAVQITGFNGIECWQNWVVAIADSPQFRSGCDGVQSDRWAPCRLDCGARPVLRSGLPRSPAQRREIGPA